MSSRNRSKVKLLSLALLVVVLSVLYLLYRLATNSAGEPSADNTAEKQAAGVDADPRVIRGDSKASARTDSLVASAEKENATPNGTDDAVVAGSDSQLQEAELVHLNDVFLNSVYPSFQYGFELDRENRAAIDVFVASMPENLSSADLEKISTMIKTQLPTQEAEELAFIITQLYRLEQEEARLMKEGPTVTTMADQLAAQERLSQLRDEWFGPELSALLFSETDAAPADAGSNASDKSAVGQEAEELPQAHGQEQAELAGLENEWEQRYQKFLVEKQLIESAGLDRAEKDRQIDVLLRQHYSPQELEAAKAFDESRQ